MNLRRGMVVGVICSLVTVGCSGGEHPGGTGQSPDESDSVGAETAQEVARTSAGSGVPADIGRLFSLMDSVGKGSQSRYVEALAELRTSPTTVGRLAALYSGLPRMALGARWKTVHTAGQIAAPGSVEFLERVASGPPEVVTSVAGHGNAVGDVSFRMRYTAAVGVVQHFAAGVDGAEASVERLLKEADPAIAQLVGVELFSLDRLSDSWRVLLDERGIANEFRRLTDSELAALRRVDPSNEGHTGADTRTRPRWTTVPAALPEEE